jgi:hypothetical protein
MIDFFLSRVYTELASSGQNSSAAASGTSPLDRFPLN